MSDLDRDATHRAALVGTLNKLIHDAAAAERRLAKAEKHHEESVRVADEYYEAAMKEAQEAFEQAKAEAVDIRRKGVNDANAELGTARAELAKVRRQYALAHQRLIAAIPAPEAEVPKQENGRGNQEVAAC